MDNYKGYKLNYYPKCEQYPFERKVVKQFKGTFEQVIDFIEEKNKNIKQKISHW